MFCLSFPYWIRFKISSWPSRPSHSWVAADMLYFLSNTDSVLLHRPVSLQLLTAVFIPPHPHFDLLIFFVYMGCLFPLHFFWGPAWPTFLKLPGWLVGSFVSFSFSFLLSTFSVSTEVPRDCQTLNHLNYLFFL